MIVRHVVTVVLVNAHAIQLALEARNLRADNDARLRPPGT